MRVVLMVGEPPTSALAPIDSMGSSLTGLGGGLFCTLAYMSSTLKDTGRAAGEGPTGWCGGGRGGGGAAALFFLLLSILE